MKLENESSIFFLCFALLAFFYISFSTTEGRNSQTQRPSHMCPHNKLWENESENIVCIIYRFVPLSSTIIQHQDYVIIVKKRPSKKCAYLSCSCKMGVRYSATLRVSTAIWMVATPSAGFPSTVCLATRSLTVM
jgi:hypothetical protein